MIYISSVVNKEEMNIEKEEVNNNDDIHSDDEEIGRVNTDIMNLNIAKGMF